MAQVCSDAVRRVAVWPVFGLALAGLLAPGHARGQAVEVPGRPTGGILAPDVGSMGVPVLPSGGVVTAGAASIASAGSTLTVTQSSGKAVLAWDGFSIGQGGAVRIENGAGATLNRVTGSSVSSIDGLLSASGSVYLINPNGVVIGKGGVVNTGGTFVASSLDVADASFLGGGDLAFAGPSRAAVINLGKVGALGGDVALIARTVSNGGSIAAANGAAGLLAGSDVLLRDAALDDGKFVVRAGGADTSATNAGSIAAAAAELRANGGNVYALAGDTAGVIRATGVTMRDGRIWLTAGDSGTTSIAGALVARAADGAGGTIETSGGTVTIGAARIDAGAGGTWLVDPNDLTIDQTAANTIASSLNAGTSVTQSTSASGSGGSGDITVSPNVALNWTTNAGLTLSAYRNIALGDGTKLASTGGGAVTLYADNTGTGTGAVTFGSGASVSTSGTVNIYYDPVLATYPYKYSAPVNYSGNVNGGGTLTAYMLVNTVADLGLIQPIGTYALGRDINVGGVIASIVGYFQYGTDGFTGVFDGQGHSISNFTIGGSIQSGATYSGISSTPNVGLFSIISGAAVIRNLNLVNGTVYLSNGNVNLGGGVSGAVGALVGSAYGGTISNVSASVNVSGSAVNFVGGLVGLNNNSTITNSYSSGTVTGSTGTYYVYQCRVSCAPTPFYISTANTGGLVGGNGGAIVNSYAAGSVNGSGSINTGGLAGYNSGQISGAYASGTVVAGSGAGVGGFVGVNASNSSGPAATITDSYWDETSTGQLLGYGTNSGTITRLVGLGGGTGYSPYAQSNYTHFTFGNGGTWYIIDGQTRPILQSEYSTTIQTPHQLQLMAMNLGANYTLGVDIDAGETSRASGVWNSATGFVPVGSDASRFSGTLDGQGHVIIGLSIINSAAGRGVGLFGAIGAAGAVRNVGVTGATIRSGNTNSVGTLAGENFGSLDNVYATGIVSRTSAAGTGYGDNIGGLVGYDSGYISNATFSGTVSNNSNAAYISIGGLVGQAGGGVIKNAFNMATIAGGGANYAGGLIGYAASTTVNSTSSSGAVSAGFIMGGLIGATSGGTVSDSYSVSSVTGANNSSMGGLIGDSEGTLANVYASGLITSSGTSYVGGLVGFGGNYAIVNGYYDVGATGQASGIGHRSGSAALSVTPVGGPSGNSSYAQSTYAGFDFSASGPWVILEGSTRPVLRFEYSTTVTNAHQLQLMALNPYVDYTLAADLDLSVTANASEIWNPATGFLPIGTGSLFTGMFRGSGHTIANLTVSRAGTDNVGLFSGVGNTGNVTNLTLTGASVTGSANVGGLAGSSTGTVNGVNVSGTVTAANSAGGLVGYNLGSVNGTATSTSTVIAGNFAGGLVGYNAGTLAGSASGSVKATGYYAGGLAGYGDGNSRISGQVSGITVSAANYAGGFAGFSGGSIAGSSSSGAITASGAVSATRGAAGLVGFNTGSITYAVSYATVTASDLGGGAVGVNFGTVTSSGASGNVGGGTQLGGFLGANGRSGVVSGDNASGAVTGTGTLGGFAGYNDGVISDSYATGTVGAAGASFVGGLVGYNARGVSSSYATGAVTGATWVGGLVGYSDTQARIANSGSLSVVSGADYVGGLAGFNGGLIDSSNASGAVSANDAGAGGLVGYNVGTIVAAYAVGSVTAPRLGGGLVGVNYGSVGRSFAAGAVRGAGDTFGGLIAANAGSASESYATGAVSGGTRVGGLAGYDSGAISDGYATGAVTGGEAATTGGLVGYLDTSGMLARGYASGILARGGGVAGTNNGALAATFYDAGTTGAASAVAIGSAGGASAVGGTTGRSAFAQSSYPGLNFLDTWTIREGQSRPYLQNNPQNPPPK